MTCFEIIAGVAPVLMLIAFGILIGFVLRGPSTIRNAGNCGFGIGHDSTGAARITCLACLAYAPREELIPHNAGCPQAPS